MRIVNELISFLIVMLIIVPIAFISGFIQAAFPFITNTHIDFFIGWMCGCLWVLIYQKLNYIGIFEKIKRIIKQ